MSNNKDTEKYKRLTQREHVLHRPGVYVGNVNNESTVMYVAEKDDAGKTYIGKKQVVYNAGFVKIFDEILTNASDHFIRTGKVKNIWVEVRRDSISIKNDGPGIPVQKKDNVWLPQMLFGELLTGENYDDSEDRFVGGMNGMGSSLTNIFSKKFNIECADGKNLYVQTFEDNLQIINEPVITKCKDSYTKVTYTPDFKYFKLDEVTPDLLSIFLKRTLDIAAYCKGCKIHFNGKPVEVSNFEDYAKMHLEDGAELFYERINENFDICIAESNSDSFEQVSIVNGISTYVGGTHVNYITNKLVNGVITSLTKGKKLAIKPNDVKNKLFVFLIARIPNPTFDTQTKENMTLKMTKEITNDCDLSDKTYKAVLKSGIIQSILDWIALREQAELNKLNKKSAGKTIRIEKLVDAHKAGTSEGWKASLFLAEGDSAKTTAIAGISAVGREYYGVFPLKGKPLNVRDAVISKITANDEISNILQIVGLVPGKKYTSIAELRYGKLIFMTDADVDGISIKGLLINFIHKMWPELLEMGFCYEFITPIVIAKKGKDKVKEYYNISNYTDDKSKGKLEGWHTKYYKGLGTISSAEIKVMFKNLDKHLIKFSYDAERDGDKIDLLFNNKRSDERKDWLLSYKGEIVPDKFGKPNELDQFIDNEFIQFGNADNVRSIPDVMDGLKPSQRKILFSAFKKRMGSSEKDEMKVAQFGAYTAEVSAYHSGEISLSLAIIGMAQDFVGANNINLFIPSGQFGTRSNPGASASPRYIFTYLNPLTRLIFRPEDDSILNYLNDDGLDIEPSHYLPIIPMALVNGAAGIGTGWSTDIPKFSPSALIKVIKKKLEKPAIKYKINPSYREFTGELDWNEEKNAYVTKGMYEKTKKGVLVTELPVETWTEKYISQLNKLCDDKVIKNYIDNSTENKVHIEVIFDDIPDAQIESKLKLSSSISMNNMHTFLDNKIVKWASAEDMLDKWFDIRLGHYTRRKDQHVTDLQSQYDKMCYTYSFIKMVMSGDLVINNRKKDQIVKDLADAEFIMIDGSYDYLLSMPVYSFTKEKYDELKQRAKDKKEELVIYSKMGPGDIWMNDLVELEKAITKFGY